MDKNLGKQDVLVKESQHTITVGEKVKLIGKKGRTKAYFVGTIKEESLLVFTTDKNVLDDIQKQRREKLAEGVNNETN